MTGATSYLGRVLVSKLLSDECDVTAIIHRTGFDDASVRQVQLPLNDAAIAQLADLGPFDVVFNLAAFYASNMTDETRQKTYNANVELGSLILNSDKLVAPHSGFIQAGSFWQNLGEPPKDYYTQTKNLMSEALARAIDDGRCMGATVRLFDVMGPADWRTKLLPTLLRSLGTGQRFELTLGNQIIYPIHVKDAVAALVAAVSWLHKPEARDQGHCFFDARGGKTTLKELLILWSELAASDLDLAFGAKAYPDDQIFDPVLMPTIPGWQPSFNNLQLLEDCIRQNA